MGIVLLLGSFTWATAQGNKQGGTGAQQAPPSSSQQSADKKADESPRDNAKNEASKEPAKPDLYRETDQPREANRDKARSEDRGSARDVEKDRSGARDVEKDRSSASQRQEPRRPAEGDRQDRSREPDTAPRDTAREADRSDRTSRDSADQRRPSRERDTTASFGLTFAESEDGLEIARLSSRGVFAKAKFREGDIILSINGHRVRSEDDFFHWFHADTRERVTIVVLRDDREVTLYVEPQVLHEEPAAATRGGAWLGVDLVDRFRNQAMVLKVHPNSPAHRAGIRADDVILSVEGEEITSPDHLGQVIGGMQPGTEVEIQVDRDRQLRVVDAVLGQRNGAARPRADVGPQLIPPQPEAGTPPPPPPQFRDQPPPPAQFREELPPPRETRQQPREERRGLLRQLFQRR